MTLNIVRVENVEKLKRVLKSLVLAKKLEKKIFSTFFEKIIIDFVIYTIQLVDNQKFVTIHDG